jgi:hypothetical protein
MGFTRRGWLCSLAASRLAAQEDALLTRDPPLRRPRLLDGEAFIEDGESNVLPTIRAWDVNLRGGARVDATTESVGDGVAARYRFDAVKPGRIVHERTQVDAEALARFEGLSFWVKGDGSAGKGLATFGDQVIDAAAPFEVAGGEWRKVFVPWSRFEPALEAPARHLGFAVEPAARGQSFILDRLRLYTAPATERVEPTPRRDAPGGFPAARFLDGRERIAGALERLRAREPTTILFTGDSITAGAQLYYTVPPNGDRLEWEQAWSSAYLYPIVACHSAARRLGYDRAAFRFERWDHGKKEWVHVLQPKDGELRTVIYGAGGQESRFAAEHASEMLAHRPHLVVYQFAGNDLYNKRDVEAYYLRYTGEFLSACRAAGADVALVISPPLLSFSEPRLFSEGEAWAESLGRFARENGCAVLDARAAFLARGLHHAGDLYSDFAHPNHRGHRLLARLVEELLAPSGLTVWDDLP